MSTDPNQAKGYSGDTNVGYGLFAVKGDNVTKYVLKGKFPKARFMSVQTYNTRFQKHVDSILDVAIEPDPGSENPFRPGVDMDTEKRDFTLELVPETFYTGAPNQLKMAKGNLNHNFFYRIYSPQEGVTLTEDDLPRVSAVDAATNQPVDCPKMIKMPEYLKFPQFMVNLVARFQPFEFKSKSGVVGSNAGIPAYLYALQEMERADVVVVRFKAPRFLNNRKIDDEFPESDPKTSDVRYWSFCLQNFVRNETLACLPDFLATPDSDGMVTLIVGTGDDVKQAALAKGFNFLPDARVKKQKVLGFVYRNVLPNKTFASQNMYQGDYFPEGTQCLKTDFLAGKCGLP